MKGLYFAYVSVFQLSCIFSFCFSVWYNPFFLSLSLLLLWAKQVFNSALRWQLVLCRSCFFFVVCLCTQSYQSCCHCCCLLIWMHFSIDWLSGFLLAYDKSLSWLFIYVMLCSEFFYVCPSCLHVQNNVLSFLHFLSFFEQTFCSFNRIFLLNSEILFIIIIKIICLYMLFFFSLFTTVLKHFFKLSLAVCHVWLFSSF